MTLRLEIESTPRTPEDRASLPAEGPGQGPTGGPLPRLQATHARYFRGKATLWLGDAPIKLKTHVDLDAFEELYVLLLELVDGGTGEWTLVEKDEVLVLELERHGFDVHLEIGDEDGGPGVFRRVRFPRRAVVRLRALVEESARLLRRMLVEATAADPTLDADGALGEVQGDLAALVASVSDLPADFASQRL